MENKITLPKLVAMLALTTGKQKKLCEDFLRELFKVIGDELSRGENVRIKGFGTFKLVGVESRKSVNVATGEEHEIPGHLKVIFVPAKELASLANAAFEAFEAVEIADDLPVDALDGEVNVDEFEESVFRREEKESEDEAIEDMATADAYGAMESVDNSADGIGKEPEAHVDAENLEESVTCDESEIQNANDVQCESEEEGTRVEEQSGRHRFAWGFLSGFLAAAVSCGIIFLLVYFLGFSCGSRAGSDSADLEAVRNSQEMESELSQVTSQELEADTVMAVGRSEAPEGNSEVPTNPSDVVVYDTISTTRYLTTMAKEHYGNFNLWPIIYEENKSILGHPDRIKPGTAVVVPSLKKYGVDPKNPAHIKEAKEKGRAIYARYK